MNLANLMPSKGQEYYTWQKYFENLYTKYGQLFTVRDKRNKKWYEIYFIEVNYRYSWDFVGENFGGNFLNFDIVIPTSKIRTQRYTECLIESYCNKYV